MLFSKFIVDILDWCKTELSFAHCGINMYCFENWWFFGCFSSEFLKGCYDSKVKPLQLRSTFPTHFQISQVWWSLFGGPKRETKRSLLHGPITWKSHLYCKETNPKWWVISWWSVGFLFIPLWKRLGFKSGYPDSNPKRWLVSLHDFPSFCRFFIGLLLRWVEKPTVPLFFLREGCFFWGKWQSFQLMDGSKVLTKKIKVLFKKWQSFQGKATDWFGNLIHFRKICSSRVGKAECLDCLTWIVSLDNGFGCHIRLPKGYCL